MNKKVGIYSLFLVGFLSALIGNHEIATAFFISAFMYDAIKPEDKTK